MTNKNVVVKNRLKAFRIGQGFSQKTLASKLKLDQGEYSLMESGKKAISEELLERIAEALDTSPEELTSSVPIFPNYASNKGTQIHYEHFYSEQKEVYEKLISSQKEEIERLVLLNKQLMEMLSHKK